MAAVSREQVLSYITNGQNKLADAVIGNVPLWRVIVCGGVWVIASGCKRNPENGSSGVMDNVGFLDWRGGWEWNVTVGGVESHNQVNRLPKIPWCPASRPK